MVVRRHLVDGMAGACALAWLGACAAAPAGGSLPRVAEAPAASAMPQSSPADIADPGAAVTVSDEEDPVEALLDMAAALAHAEAHDDALRALERSDVAGDLRIAMARADLLRDLGRRHEAVAVLRGIRERIGPAALDPQALFELAELERLEGERDAARRTLAMVRERHADAAWTRANASRLQLVDGQLAAGEPVRAISARDLLGNLRGAPDPGDRLAALQTLLAGAYGDPDEATAVRERAVAIAVGDGAEAVRLAGVTAWTFDADVALDFLALALVDGASSIRRAAIAHVGKLPPAAARALLFARLQQEQDAAVFLALHDALRVAAGAGDAITPLDAATVEGRAAVVTQWRRAGLAVEGA